MTGRWGHDDGVESEAVAWLLRVDALEASEADWLGLEAWLTAAAEHRVAFDRADLISSELTLAAGDIVAAMDAPAPAAGPQMFQPRRAARRKVQEGDRRIWRPVAGIAAAAAAAVLFVAVRPPALAPAELFQTPKGESRLLNLADGSRIHLNSGSRLSVRLEKAARRVNLAEGEAAFDVAHDPARPFLIAAGERTIRVVGTEFAVLRHDGRLRVTVRRGIVSVQSADGASRIDPIVLRAGDQLDHHDGEGPWMLQKVDPEAAFAWKRGDLVYRDQSLSEVVSDLNRYFQTPVSVTGAAASLRFSGVLRIERQDAVVRRLQAFLPVVADHKGDGVILRMRRAG